MTGGDERTAVHQLLALIADRPEAVRALAALLVAAGRFDAAAVVAGGRMAATREGGDGTTRPGFGVQVRDDHLRPGIPASATPLPLDAVHEAAVGEGRAG